jgi:hypothetical protein
VVKNGTLVLSPRQVAEALLRAAVENALAKGTPKRRLKAFRGFMPPTS